MSNQRKILHDDRNGLDYVLVGDYYLPVLSLPEETRPIGYWGMLRKEYMKNYKSGMYSYLLLTGKLDSYLAVYLILQYHKLPLDIHSRNEVYRLV